MKNFDEARAKRAADWDRNFQIGGETFTMRVSTRPEVMTEWEDLDPSAVGPTETLRVVDNTILSFIEEDDDAHARWRALREREDDALGLGDLQELISWLVEQQTMRPTLLSSVSTSGYVNPTTGTPLTDDSSSPDAPEEPEASTSNNSATPLTQPVASG